MNNTKRDSASGQFHRQDSVAVITDKSPGGKVGSYSVRTVDKGRFAEAMRIASSSLKSSASKKR